MLLICFLEKPADDINHTKLMSSGIWNLEIETGLLLEGKKRYYVWQILFF